MKLIDRVLILEVWQLRGLSFSKYQTDLSFSLLTVEALFKWEIIFFVGSEMVLEVLID